ncbi:thiamine-phosphate pyrophosphorylase [Bryocella elongata]|uniref:Thiamine-phosphate synthase n=1 Tax=Bryocella elongata TaxID=863522 RepID=A0A1H5UKR2_9BACT|nr:thiamine phosphate synthase [Bryocella elongata]SEF75620.1 thiamine-phosphate pyrophosphorylase [Bryocella elongata]
MKNGLPLSRLYAIVDRETLDRRGLAVGAFACELRAAGVVLLQYRDKQGSPQQVLDAAAEIKAIFAGSGATLILNDRADLTVLAEWDGVHVGHTDMSPEAVRRVIGPDRILGVSTHNEEQIREADASVADYIAVGPVYATTSKTDTEPVTGLEGVRAVRALTAKPLVAIGGITQERAPEVLAAGADSVAVIGALLPAGGREIGSHVAMLLAATLNGLPATKSF